MRFMSFEKNKR